MLDFFKVEQHRIVFSIFAILVGIVLIIGIIFGVLVVSRGLRGGLNTISTMFFSGEGKVSVKPDTAFIDFSVVTQGGQIEDVQNANTTKMNKVIDFLKSYGIEDKDIKTANYNLYPQYTYENNQIPQIMGYQITQTLSVKVKNLDKVGDILKKVVGMGINQVNSLYFGVENDEQVKEQARALAISDAKDKAGKLASQLGIKLRKLTGFSENASGYPIPMYDTKGYGIGGGGSSPVVQPGENEIIIDVILTYEIQ